MVTTKRSRPVDGEDVIIAIDRANSEFRQGHDARKKPRLSGLTPGSKPRQRPRERSATISESGEPELVPEDLPPSTQYDLDRDAGFRHLDDTGRDDERATQRLLSRSQLLGENHAAENGIIESVTMSNFMCHDKLHVTLGPLINFIIGHNGSGKSAILTAITLCLGGKASTTNRGGSLKSFIKEGRDQAGLVIRLKNQGSDAYQPEVFGNSIIVERNFTKSGTSGFKLKNSDGRLVSVKKTDVEEVIEYFQMQIDNPMNVLTQDAARQFLNTATPAQKYRFFVKGVQLEQLDNDYRLLSETCDAMEAKLEVRREQVKFLARKAAEAAEKARIVNENQSMRDAMQEYAKQAAWAQVEEEELKLHERDVVVTEARDRIEQALKDAELKAITYDGANEAVSRAEEATRQLGEDVVPLKEEEAEAKAAFDAATQELQNIHLEHRQIRDHLQAAKKNAERILDDISSEQQRLEGANGGAHIQRLNELSIAQEKVTETTRKLIESVTECRELERQSQITVEDYEKSRIPIEKKQKEVSACENQLQAMKRDAGQIMSAFDPKIPRLINMILTDDGFREKPIGPVGLHIKLTKPIWSTILERSIGNILNGFIVTNKSDQARLQKMIEQLRIEFCPILIGNKQPIDTRGHEPDEQYDTVLRILEIDNDLVRKHLVIAQGIEQTILVEDRQAASKVMYGGGRLQNVKQCFCLNESRRGWGVSYSYMTGTALAKSNPIIPTGHKPRMKTNLESQIQFQEETYTELRRELSDLQNRQRQLHLIRDKSFEAVTKQKRIHGGLQLELQQAEDEVERLQEVIDRDNVEDGRLEAFKEHLKEAEGEVSLHSGSYEEAVLAKEKQNAISLSLKQALDVVKQSIEEHDAKIKKAEGKLKRHKQARQIALQEKNIAVEAVDEMKTARLTAERKRDKQAERVASFIYEASKICARVPIDDGETAASLDAKLTHFSETMKSYNTRLGGTDQEILQAFEEADKVHKTAESQLDGLELLLTALKKSYQKRLEMWRRFQRHISAQSRISFTYLLSERGFRGKLKIDHIHKLLDLEIEPDETKKSARGRATKTLSGGEKSFSSICLLLSLWEAMGAPLRCLDEFDVFMDNVNRDVSTNMIIGAARRSVGRQYILITPNAIGGGAENDRDVKMIRLTDPRQLRLTDL